MIDNPQISIDGYTILEKLGQGGMGVVYKALDEKLKRHVAIKFLFNDANNSGANSILSEAQNLAKVNHPNVVQIYELKQSSSAEATQDAIVMEYLSGTTLANLNKEKLLTQEQKLEYLIQICAGMEAIHKQGLIHGDLKAENIWVTEDNTVKLLDFGLSSKCQTESKNHVSGEGFDIAKSASLSTLTPEFCIGKPLTYKSDIFVFGCLSCKLLSNKLPFDTSSLDNQIKALVEGHIEKASKVVPALSAALTEFIDKCLMCKPAQRPDSFHHIKQELQNVLNVLKQQQLAANATIPFEQVQKVQSNNTRKKPVTYLLSVISFVLLLTVTVFWNSTNKPNKTHTVLVLPPKSLNESNFDSKQSRMIKAAIDNTLRNLVITANSLYLVPRGELAFVKPDLESSLQATGASYALQPLVDCQLTSCEIVIEQIDGSTRLITKRVRWHTVAMASYEIDELTKTYFYNLFPDVESINTGDFSVSQNSMSDYLAIYAELVFTAGNTRTQLSRLKSLLKENPQLFPAYSLYREIALKTYLDSGEESFLTELDQILSNAPREYMNTTLFTRDKFLLTLYQNKFEEAKNMLEIAEEMGIDDITLRELKGSYYLEKNEPQKAKSFFEQALQLRFSVFSLFNLALSQWYSGRPDLAEPLLLSALKISPNDYATKQQLASLYLLTGQLNSARIVYGELVETNPESRDLSNLGLTLLLLGDLQNALIYAREAAALSPQNTVWLLNLADIEMLNGNVTEAQVIYKQLLDAVSDKKDLDSLLLKAQAYIHLRNPLEALKAINHATSLSPNNGEVAFISALVHTIQGEHMAAIVKVGKSLESGVGAVWYNLPWFKPLCRNPEFKKLFEKQNRSVQQCRLDN